MQKPALIVIVGKDCDPTGPCHGWRPWIEQNAGHTDPYYYGHDQPPSTDVILQTGAREIVLLGHSFGGTEAYILAKALVDLTSLPKEHKGPVHNIWLVNADSKPKGASWFDIGYKYPIIPYLLPHRVAFFYNGFGRPYGDPGCNNWKIKGHNEMCMDPHLLSTLSRYTLDAQMYAQQPRENPFIDPEYKKRLEELTR